MAMQQSGSELHTWEEAFEKYPIHEVRTLEKRVRKESAEKGERLRSLVGANYRNLLGTARRIVEVDGQMHEAEAQLSQLGKQSDSRLIERFNRGYFKFTRSLIDEDELTYSASCDVLQKCLRSVQTLLASGGSTLLAAKLLVIARRLQMSLIQLQLLDSEEASDKLGRCLASIRQKLLRAIDKRLAQGRSSSNRLVEDMTAFSLATSSSPMDVLRHFQHLRREKICQSSPESDLDVRKVVSKRLKLFLTSLGDLRRAFPDLLASSLRTLSARPLMDDDSIKKLGQLSLDTRQAWLPKEVRVYTPWTHRDALEKSKVDDSVQLWAKATFDAMLQTMQEDLKLEHSFDTISQSRKDILQTWLSSPMRSSRYGLNSNVVVKQLRSLYLAWFEEDIQNICIALPKTLLLFLEEKLGKWNTEIEATKPSSFLDINLSAMDFSNGATELRNSIVNARNGRSIIQQQTLQRYEEWAKTVLKIHQSVYRMRDIRWEDDFDEDEEDYRETSGNNSHEASAQDALSRHDPDHLTQRLFNSLDAALSSISTPMNQQLDRYNEDFNSPRSEGIFIFRLCRDLSARMPSLAKNITGNQGGSYNAKSDLPEEARTAAKQLTATSRTVFKDVIDSATHSIVSGIAHQSCESFTLTLNKAFGQGLIEPLSKTLWDGTPLLPLNTNHRIFSWLVKTHKDMERLGRDLWSKSAVEQLKLRLWAGVIDTGMEMWQTLNAAQVEDVTKERTGEELDTTSDETSGETNELKTKDESTEQADVEGSVSEAQNSVMNEESSGTPNIEKIRDLKTQLFFDLLYLCHALTDKAPLPPENRSETPTKPDTVFTQLLEAVLRQTEKAAGQQRAADLMSEEIKAPFLNEVQSIKLRKNVYEYWRRTWLLVGLLAP